MHPLKTSALIIAAIAAATLAGCAQNTSVPTSAQGAVDPRIEANSDIPDAQQAAASEQLGKVPSEYRDKIPPGANPNPNAGN